MKKSLAMLATVAYLLAVVVASAGAITNGFANAQYFYAVAGIINVLVGGFIAFRFLQKGEVFNQFIGSKK